MRHEGIIRIFSVNQVLLSMYDMTLSGHACLGKRVGAKIRRQHGIINSSKLIYCQSKSTGITQSESPSEKLSWLKGKTDWYALAKTASNKVAMVQTFCDEWTKLPYRLLPLSGDRLWNVVMLTVRKVKMSLSSFVLVLFLWGDSWYRFLSDDDIPVWYDNLWYRIHTKSFRRDLPMLPCFVVWRKNINMGWDGLKTSIFLPSQPLNWGFSCDLFLKGWFF